MAIFGAQGIRDAIKKSYFRHVQDLKEQPLPEGTTLHQAALYGALATRYMVGFQNVHEFVIWAELSPFLHLEPNEGLKALAEYIVYKEVPNKADIRYLACQVQHGLSIIAEEDREALEEMVDIHEFPWIALK